MITNWWIKQRGRQQRSIGENSAEANVLLLTPRISLRWELDFWAYRRWQLVDFCIVTSPLHAWQGTPVDSKGLSVMNSKHRFYVYGLEHLAGSL
jgi:hypothetical protein